MNRLTLAAIRLLLFPIVNGYVNPLLSGARQTGSKMKGTIGIVLPIIFRQYKLVANDGSHG